MTVEAALRAYLVGNSGVHALVGERVYTQTMPQDGQLPAITFQRVSTVAVNSRADNSFGQVRVQIDGWADSDWETKALRAAIRSAMKGFKMASGPRVSGARLRDSRDLHDQETRRWRVLMDYMIWCDEG